MLYHVQRDDQEPVGIFASCLSEVTNKVRGSAQRIRIWAPSGLQLIDTKFGDNYVISKDNQERN